ncbi:MAG TPA: hypothetical protein VLH09_05360, partial [Bryobacteraceae bacterium]|nr:hypothetical protein [Bryobacteraceae bacterium]
MSFASTLFARPPQILPAEFLPADAAQKTADIRLNSPPEGWADEILQSVMRDHPYLPTDQLVVNFQRQDPALGYGVGFISILSAPKVSLPIIINNRGLKPIDLMIVRHDDQDEGEDDIQPLTEDTYASVVDAGGPGDVVTPDKVRNTNWTEDGSVLQVPFRGRTVVASVLGAREATKLAFGELLGSNRDIAAGFALHNEAVAEAWLNAPEPRCTIQQKLAGAELPQAQAKVATDLPEERSPNDFLAAFIYRGNGEAKAAAVFTTANLLNPGQTKDMLLFEDGTYCPAPEKVAVAVVGESEDAMAAAVMAKVAATGLRVGETVSFLVDDVFTSPAKIASLSVHEKQAAISVDLVDGLGVRFPVVLSQHIKVAMLDEKSGRWVIPMSAQVLKLAHYASPDEQPMPIEKVAKAMTAAAPYQLVKSADKITLSLHGDAQLGLNQVPEQKAAEVLRHWFSNSDALLNMVKTSAAQHGGTGFIRFDCDLATIQATVTKEAEHFLAFPGTAKELLDQIS